MKKSILYHILFICIVVIAAPGISIAQKHPHIENQPKYDLKPYHFGFLLCINQMDFAVRTNPNFNPKDTLLTIESAPQYGFNIGIVSNLRLGEYTDLRFLPTLSFGERMLDYTIRKDTTTINDSKKVESTYLDFPLLLKYKSKRLNNARAYIITGLQYSIDLASQAKKKDKNNDLIKLRSNDVMYQFGVGFDFYFDTFKFSTELKMLYGVRDLLLRDNTALTSSIKRLNSKIFQLSFLFE